MTPVRNDRPRASRSAVAAFFTRMDVVVWQQVGGGCGSKGSNNDGGNKTMVATMVAT